MSTRDCPSDAQLRAFAIGELDGASVEETIDHVDHCTRCQSRFESLEHRATGRSTLLNELRRLRDHRPEDGSDTPDDAETYGDVDAPDDADIVGRLLTRRRPIAEPAWAEPPPERIGPYVLVRKLASGGMGTVYEGRHVHLGRSIAIKWLGAGQIDSREHAERVLREWRAHGILTHPKIVAATDAGLIEGRPYLVTELVRGADLNRIVSALGPLQLRDAARIVRDVASALDYAHGQGVVHLDIKPSNVMIDRSGSVKVLDLGTAQVVELARASGDGDASEQFGTIGFLPPERGDPTARDQADVEIDPFAADVYSLGCTLYYLLTGTPPFGSPSTTPGKTPTIADVLAAHRETPPPTPCLLQDDASATARRTVQQLLDRMLAKAPSRRPTAMSEIVDVLDPLACGADIESVIAAYEQGQPAAEFLPSGHTVRLTDLVPHSGSRSTLPIVVGASFLALLLVVVASSLMRPATPGSAAAGGDHRAAGVSGQASRAGSERTVAEPSRVAPRRVSDWVPKPPRDAGLFPASQQFLTRQQTTHADVIAATVHTTVPRDPVRKVAWSPEGDRLAVLTEPGCLRLYSWNDGRLELQSLYQETGDDPPILDFGWHPWNGDLILAARDKLGLVATAPLEKAPAPSPRPPDPKGVERVQILADGGRVLIVVSTTEGLIGWDPLSGQRVTGLVRRGSDRMATNGSRYAVRRGGEIECWQARFESPAGRTRPISSTERSSPPADGRWVFERLGSYPLQTPDQVTRLAIDRTGTRLTVTRPDGVTVRRFQDFSLRSHFDDVVEPDTPAVAVFNGFDPDRDEILVASRTRLRLRSRRHSEEPAADNETTVRTAREGERSGLRADFHPAGTLIAVASAGRLAVWDRELNTVASLPGLSRIDQVLPLELQPAAIVCTADGGAAVISSEGVLRGTPLPPLSPDASEYAAIDRHAVIEPQLELIQSASRETLPPTRRSLIPFGLQPVEADMHTFSVIPSAVAEQLSGGEVDETENPADWSFGAMFVPEAMRTATRGPVEVRRMPDPDPAHVTLASQAEVMVTVDARGRYVCYRIDRDGSVRRQQGNLRGFAGDLSISLSRDGRTLFVAAIDDQRGIVGAIHLPTRKPLWKIVDAKLRDRSYLNVLADGELLLTNRAGWRLIDPATGETLGNVRPGERDGFMPTRARVSRHDGSLYSWNGDGRIEPAVAWSPDLTQDELTQDDLTRGELTPEWIVLATAANGWIVLSPDGRVISEHHAASPIDTPSADTPPTHNVALSADGDPAVTETSPGEALSVILHHEDGHTTIEPFVANADRP